jgi:hypothetical protein
MLETHLSSKATEKRKNFDPSTPPAYTEHLHFKLNGEIRRAPRPPSITCAQIAWEDVDHKWYAVLLQISLCLISIAPWTDRPPPREKRETE